MRLRFGFCLSLVLILGMVNVSHAHFGLILPDKAMVMQGDNPNLGLILAFCQFGSPLRARVGWFKVDIPAQGIDRPDTVFAVSVV